MIVSELSSGDLESCLNNSGLFLRTGPFVGRLNSPLPQILEAVRTLYADFSIVDGPFADFEVSIDQLGGVRRWVSPRAYFLLRGQSSPALGFFSPRMAPVCLEWGLNYAVYGQINSYLILHAAVLERGGHAVVILGESGAGKSTLCAGLALSGWRLLTDELGLLGLSDGRITPIVRPVNLKNRSIDVIREFSGEASFGPVCWTKRKGLVCCMRPPTDSVRQMDTPARPSWLVFVRHSSGASLTAEDIPRAEAFPELIRSSFNYHNLGAIGFDALCRMMDQVKCVRLTYCSLQAAVDHFDSQYCQS